ncbi:vitamin K epoxide reductase family protein [Cellulomonas sp. PhB150]|uniref:vitamin K epoxide reductase family protein n=1 Tax=Cellulomonas sp. PhB150 TaxID=2485188 RepID=UPI000FA4D590|nr:vitamin K epoxide reductase family protein [Cellulomonas sp. PhB150]ROS23129.1 putative membrane protein [Cellulomonas sp. PhB150]
MSDVRSPGQDEVDEVDEVDDDLDVLIDDDPDLLEPPTDAWRRRTAIEMVISGALGLLASFVLSIDALKLAADPKANLGCSINAVLDCAKVADTWQAHLLGEFLPNAFLGIAAEAVVITIAVAMIGNVRFPRWYMLAAEAVYTVGFLFAYWLFYQALTDIHALCPWCLLITVTTTLVWAGLTRINIREGHIALPGKAGPAARRFVRDGYDWFVTIGLLVVVALIILVKYGSALFQ